MYCYVKIIGRSVEVWLSGVLVLGDSFASSGVLGWLFCIANVSGWLEADIDDAIQSVLLLNLHTSNSIKQLLFRYFSDLTRDPARQTRFSSKSRFAIQPNAPPRDFSPASDEQTRKCQYWVAKQHHC